MSSASLHLNQTIIHNPTYINIMKHIRIAPATIFLALILHLVSTDTADAHCDSMNGPVVLAAKQALASGDVTPVMKWILEDQEAEVVAAFNRTMEVRGENEAVREMVDTYFFETVVRLHRMSEGVGYTGLKPAVSVEPGIAAADIALETGSIEALEQYLLNQVRNALNDRFIEATSAHAHADHSVEAGRAFVESYVRYTHLVEGIEAAIAHTSAEGHLHSADHAH